MPSFLQRSLLATLAYFDLFDYPLTLMELERYRYCFLENERTPIIGEILEALQGMPEAVAERDGFWHLADRGDIVGIRERRYRLAEAKFAKARMVTRILRVIPSVRLVTVCNSLALSNADSESDIDLFVVARSGCLWVTRLIIVGALAALRLRPNRKSHADKVCMSFFVSERALDLSRIAIRPHDTYLQYWVASLVPLYDAGGVFQHFLEQNIWIKHTVPGALRARRSDTIKARWTERFLPLLRAFEPFAKKIQLRLFPAEIRVRANQDNHVVISDDMLKFHVTDRREEYERKFRAQLFKLGLDESILEKLNIRVERLKVTPKGEEVRRL